MTIWERFMAGNDEVIPIRLIDFDAGLIAEYLAPACPDSTILRENATILPLPRKEKQWLQGPNLK